jgi:CheY-like chemotaxis protein
MGIRVTVVEDDEVLRNAICEAVADDARLELVGQYRDAEGFLERVAIDGPEVVIMDIGLPGIDGVTAMRKVKAKLPEVQFLVSTVQDDDDHLFRGHGLFGEGCRAGTGGGCRLRHARRRFSHEPWYRTPCHQGIGRPAYART